MLEAVSVVLLVAVLAVAVVRPRAVPDAAVAVPAALIVIAVGAVSWGHARAELGRLGPVVGFLAAVLALADACAAEGLFAAAGNAVARATGRSGRRMLVGVVGLAAATTAVLSLDTTVVLLTPVVLATLREVDLPARPSLYACAHIANSGSLLLPVSNLTNLLAVAVVPISFTRFAALMALPWLVTLAVTFVVLRVFFRADVSVEAVRAAGPPFPFPRFAGGVLALTLAGFVVTSFAGVAPVWAAVGGAVVLAGKRVLARQTHPWHVIVSAAPQFCAFVLALGVVVRAVSDQGLGHVVPHLLPAGASLVDLLAVAGVAAVLSNLVNNLPATLLLLPIAATHGVAPVLAVLVGVNIGPNLTYPGSLATLLWRRVLVRDGLARPLGEFTAVGLALVPVSLVAATVALWLSVRLIGVA